jgi:hypothetical protein
MHNNNNNRADHTRDFASNRGERASSTPNDLPDSENDQEKLKPEETTIDLPDVKDIPGQEFVNGPSLDAIGDTTISSADEEGDAIFEVDDDEDFRSGTEGDVSRDERRTLAQSDYMPTRDEDNLQRAKMDNVDFQGESLNERSFGEERTGSDLDVPDESDQNSSDIRGAEDEENRFYSLGSDENDNAEHGDNAERGQ